MRTSSLLVCFCLLALMVEPPASLGAAPLGWDSNAGRGIFEAGLLLKAGTAPRPWPRLGVPLIVPVDAMVSKYPGAREKVWELGGWEVQDWNAKR